MVKTHNKNGHQLDGRFWCVCTTPLEHISSKILDHFSPERGRLLDEQLGERLDEPGFI